MWHCPPHSTIPGKCVPSLTRVNCCTVRLSHRLVTISAGPYAGGSWKVHVELPEGYPYKSPSIGFCNRMFHPNVDEMSGTVCLDVINQTWSPMFDLLNVFEVFLPQLLLYPNPTDPLNGEAAALMMREPEKYQERIQETVAKYANAAQMAAAAAADDDDDDDDDESDDDE